MAPSAARTRTPQQDTWDVVVIGGGPAGENAADHAVRGSDRTAVIVEAELVGGECSYWACMPSKALLRSVEVARVATGLAGLAGRISPDGIDVDAVLARRDAFTSHLDDAGQVTWAEGAGIDVVRGRARLQGVKTIEVDDGVTTRVIHAREAVVVATGTTAAVPPVRGLAEALPWTSRDVTNLHEVPRRVAVVGGGVVACEAATWLLGLGVEELTVIEPGERLLGRAEPFAGELVAAGLRARGATVLLGRSVDSVTRVDPQDRGVGHVGGGSVTLRIGRRRPLEVDEVVVATGRTPATDDLGLESLGLAEAVADHRGYLPVDDRLEVRGVPGHWLYAVGDVNGRALLTHMGKYQARIAGAVIAARAAGERLNTRDHKDRASERAVPSVTFTAPEVASVGLTEAAAVAAGIDVETVEHDMAAVAGSALLRDDYVGRAKLVIDRSRDTLVGATFVGDGSAELLHSATVAVVGSVTLADLWHAVPGYPTVSEIWLRLLEDRRSR